MLGTMESIAFNVMMMLNQQDRDLSKEERLLYDQCARTIKEAMRHYEVCTRAQIEKHENEGVKD